MKNVLKTLGIICIIAAALFISACGDLPEATPAGPKTNPDGTISVPKGSPVNQPSAPADKTEPPELGLYKNFIVCEFDGWYDGSTKITDWPYTPDTDVTLTPKWKPLENLLPSGTGDPFSKAVTYLKTGNNAGTTDKFVLALDSPVTATAAIEMTKGDLKIVSTTKGQRNITSGVSTGVFLTVGDGSSGTTTAKLTLNNVVLKGSGTAVANSLVTVKKGGELVLDDQSGIKEHNNSIGNGTSANAAGNGSAINVNEGTLTIMAGAVIENNQSTGTNQPNRNLVGGVFGYKGNLNILGGNITDNICPYVKKNPDLEDVESNRDYQHTKDVYVTEWCTLTISGNTKIGEITLNADLNKADQPIDYAVINIPNAVTNTIDKLCLRSSIDVLSTIKERWKDQPILKGSNYTITSDDIDRFHLAEFRGKIAFNAAFNISDEFMISKEVANLGYLIRK